jgi:hypothetical protein
VIATRRLEREPPLMVKPFQPSADVGHADPKPRRAPDVRTHLPSRLTCHARAGR